MVFICSKHLARLDCNLHGHLTFLAGVVETVVALLAVDQAQVTLVQSSPIKLLYCIWRIKARLWQPHLQCHRTCFKTCHRTSAQAGQQPLAETLTRGALPGIMSCRTEDFGQHAYFVVVGKVLLCNAFYSLASKLHTPSEVQQDLV